jgi:hypothetical protein
MDFGTGWGQLHFGLLRDVLAHDILTRRVRALHRARAEAMSEAKPTVFVVDDDPEMREALDGLLRSLGLQSKPLASVGEFLDKLNDSSARPKENN